MAAPPIPDDVRRFVLTSVASVPFIEALLLFRSSRGEDLAAESLARRLYVSDDTAKEVVGQLVEARILRASGEAPARYRFLPESPDLEQLLDRVADCYAHNLIEMTQLIHSRRARQAQQFADAFRLRKEP